MKLKKQLFNSFFLFLILPLTLVAGSSYQAQGWAKRVVRKKNLTESELKGDQYGVEIDYGSCMGPLELHLWSAYHDGKVSGTDDDGDAVLVDLERREGMATLGLRIPCYGLMTNLFSGYGHRKNTDYRKSPLEWKLTIEYDYIPVGLQIDYELASFCSIGIRAIYFHMRDPKWKYNEHPFLNGLGFPLDSMPCWRVELPFALQASICGMSVALLAGLGWEYTQYNFGNETPFAPQECITNEYGGYVGFMIQF